MSPSSSSSSDAELSIGERAFSAAGAAVISAIIVNPLDVAKTRLQAQAAGVPYPYHYICLQPNAVCQSPSTSAAAPPPCHSGCNRYKGTLDVLHKVVRQEGFIRLWRGTTASLALAVPTVGIYMPCYDIFRNFMEEFTTQNAPNLTPYVPLVAGSVARSLACVSCYPVELARTRMQAFKATGSGKPPGVFKTLIGAINPIRGTERLQSSSLQIRKKLLGLVGDEATAAAILGANFTAGFVAGTVAAAATCPLDVAKTRRQIEKDRERALKMTTRTTLIEIWRDGGLRGLFTGVGPRVGRAGPSVGIVVSFYEVVKHALHRRQKTSS
ncbi:mitochondrial carrier protein MTM1 isoform X3 [Arachis stenosperma]|uniref:mitochondrial carrier protein MTM1 isoform X3 n=1 Tax=Arachis stenosperma TaxID=217475 RepID=UPI0025AB82AB|nr:mitochondrial carrier protein MTM1 isoform X3 [Arachis stenosperma]